MQFGKFGKLMKSVNRAARYDLIIWWNHINGQRIVEVELETNDKTYFVGGQEIAGGKETDHTHTHIHTGVCVRWGEAQQMGEVYLAELFRWCK